MYLVSLSRQRKVFKSMASRSRVSLELKDDLIILIDKLKLEYGANRSRTLETLLEDLLLCDEQEHPSKG